MGHNSLPEMVRKISTEEVSKVFNLEDRHIALFCIEKWKNFINIQKEKIVIREKKKILDSKLLEIGRFLNLEEVRKRIPNNVYEYYKNLKPYIGDPGEKEYLEMHKIIMQPFQYSADNSIYDGAWHYNCFRQGYGYLINTDGSLFEGLWLSGDLYKGRIIYSSGDYYEGRIKHLEPSGEGIFNANNDIKYIGGFKKGKYNFYGQLLLKDKTFYKGNFTYGNFDGQGSITWPNGLTYTGNFSNQTIAGKGKMITNNNQTYNGDWENNLFHGYGKYEWKQEGDKYEGEFKYGKRDGKGIYTFANRNYYQGKWKFNKPHGFGTYYNGSKEISGIWRYGVFIERKEDDIEFLTQYCNRIKRLDHLLYKDESLLVAKYSTFTA